MAAAHGQMGIVVVLRRDDVQEDEIRMERHASPSTVSGDRTQLQNALLNLAVNARDAMPDGATLTFATRNVRLKARPASLHGTDIKRGSYVEIRVIDTGLLDEGVLALHDGAHAAERQHALDEAEERPGHDEAEEGFLPSSRARGGHCLISYAQA